MPVSHPRLPLSLALLTGLLTGLLLAGCGTTDPASAAATPEPVPLPRPGERPGGAPREVRPYAALDAADAAERVVGVQMLQGARDPHAADRISAMLADPAGEVRAAAVEGLRLIEGAPHLVARVRPLAADPDARVRGAVVRFLAGRDGPASIELFRERFRTDEDSEVRALALASLATFDEAGADLPAVIELHGLPASEQPDGALRVAAVLYLCRHAEGADARELLVPLLGDPDPGLRGQAARSLADARIVSATQPLAAAFRTERDTRAAAEMLLAHSRLGGLELRQDALSLLAKQRAPWLLQSAAASVLGTPTGSVEEAAEVLGAAMLGRERDPRVAQAAAASLGRLGQTERLERALSDERAEVRRMAVLAYPAGEDGRALELARQLIRDPDPEVVWASVIVRSRLGDTTAYPELVEGLRKSISRAADALIILREITGGDPDHGLSYAGWHEWLESAAPATSLAR